jgi:hypothetical protein
MLKNHRGVVYHKAKTFLYIKSISNLSVLDFIGDLVYLLFQTLSAITFLQYGTETNMDDEREEPLHFSLNIAFLDNMEESSEI